VWVKFFIDIRDKGEAGSFIIAFIHFPLGALIVAFHNVWHGIPLILTLIGCGLTLKGLIYFLFPQYGLKAMSRVSLEKSYEFVIAGVMSIALSGLFMFSLINRS
jgi:hypothetical protein